MSEHTKGPWEIETPLDRFNQGSDWDAEEDWTPDYPRKVCVRKSGLGGEICEMSGVHDRTMPDARLIAAAPELLEALKAIANLPAHPMRKKSLEIAHAAISKAEAQNA